MAVKILHGVIEEISEGVVVNGNNYVYEFIKIAGQRVRKISCDNYLGSFIKIGTKVRIGCVAGKFGGNVIMSFEEEDGTISKVDNSNLIVMMMPIFFFSIIIFALILLFLYIQGGRQDAFFFCVSMPFILTYLLIKPYYKARNCLDLKVRS
ncbi:MAG: hypothetical protein ACOH2R_23975 [Pseudomonas sp.]